MARLELVPEQSAPLLEVAGLKVSYRGRGRRSRLVAALDGVDLTMQAGRTVGLVGESGSGKSTLGRAILGLAPISGGSVRFCGRDITRADVRERRVLSREIQVVFQDPYGSLNPTKSVGSTLGEPLRVQRDRSAAAIKARVAEVLDQVGLPADAARRFPGEFSGGQRQRIAIARALVLSPSLIICDEPVSALDLSIQAQILNLFMDLRRELDLTYLFISHDLGVVEHLSDRVMIMYLGRIVEQASAQEIFSHANHPYTRALLAEVPRIEARKQRFTAITGEIPSPLNPPSGCHFHPRCPHAMARCSAEVPAFREIAPGHRSACHLNEVAQ
jgi:oligopeptide/dipeptide ABC transporter ATP-binding protein